MTSKLLIVGTGAIARSHAAANEALVEYGLTTGPLECHATDVSPAALSAFLRDRPTARGHRDLATLLAEPADPGDIVVVATTPTSHADIIEAALRSGRHTLAEKPMALPAARAAQLAALAQSLGLVLHEASNRFLGSSVGRRVAQIVRSGALGTIYQASWIHLASRARPGIEFLPDSRWFLDRAIAGGGVALDWSGYDLANLSEALGNPGMELVAQFAAQPHTDEPLPLGTIKDVEFHVGATLLATMADGSRFPITYQRASATHAQPGDRVEIVGTRAAIRWGWLPWAGPELTITMASDTGGIPRVVTESFASAAEPPFHHRPLAGMVAELAGIPDTRFPTVPASQAAHRLALLEAMTATVAQ